MIFITGGAYQGKGSYAREHFPQGYRVVNGYHALVRRQLEEGRDPLREAGRLLEEGGAERLIVISDEVGCGVVPVDAFERRYREAAGRVSCYLAERAEQVIRVVCGIGVRIK